MKNYKDGAQFRELEPTRDVTQEIIDGELLSKAKNESMMQDFDLAQTYSAFWAESTDHNVKPVALNPNIIGEEISLPPTNPIFEGPMAAPPNLNTKGIPDSRATIFKRGDKHILLKGTGRKYLSSSSDDLSGQFGNFFGGSFEAADKGGWGSLGGLLETTLKDEIQGGYEFAEAFHRIYGFFPPARLPKRIHDITDALKREGNDDIKQHFQIEYEVETPVRTSYAYFLRDLPYFWRGLDIREDPQDREKAVYMLNELFFAYTQKYNSKPMIPLELNDVEKMFQLTNELENVLMGEEPEEVPENYEDLETEMEGYTEAEKQRLIQLQAEISSEGQKLAQRFFELNEEAVLEAFTAETSKLARTIGFSMATGIDLGASITPKDSYGSAIADTEVIHFKAIEEDNGNFLNYSLSHSFSTFNELYHMMGIPIEYKEKILDAYMNEVSYNLGFTLENIEKLNLKLQALERIKQHLQALVDAPSKGRAHSRYKTILLPQSQALLDTFGIEVTDDNTAEAEVSLTTWGRSMNQIDLNPLFLSREREIQSFKISSSKAGINVTEKIN